MAISLMVGFIFVLLRFFMVVMKMESLSTAISSRFGGSGKALADIEGFCMPCLTAWEECTSVTTTTF